MYDKIKFAGRILSPSPTTSLIFALSDKIFDLCLSIRKINNYS